MNTTIVGLLSLAVGWFSKWLIAKVKLKPDMVDATTDSYRELIDQLTRAMKDQEQWLAERAELKAEITQLNTTIEDLKAQIAGLKIILENVKESK